MRAAVTCCCMVATLVVSAISACQARQDAQTPMQMAGMDSSDEQRATIAAQDAMSGPTPEDLHMTLTPQRPPSATDSTRAARVLVTMRAALSKYRDVAAAEADGFRQFLPGVRQATYHFTNRRWAIQEMLRFDPAKPTSLLYRQDSEGRFVLVGAMYAAPARLSFDDLDRRIPLSVVRWHEHVHWCVPPVGHRERWGETRGGQPVFGPKSPIATAEACDVVGGRFLPRIFGWMVHVMAFEGDDPAVIWGGYHAHHHS